MSLSTGPVNDTGKAFNNELRQEQRQPARLSIHS
jgi:hypothetical protein